MNDHERVEAHRAGFPDAGVPLPVRAITLPAAAILLAVVLAGVNPAPAQAADVRTLTMRAAPDDSYRAQPNWEGNLRTNVAAVSALYEKAFQIRFVLLDIVPWAAAPGGDRVRQISKLMADVPPGRADLVVAFSGRCEGTKAGWTWLFDRYALVTSGCGIFADQTTAQAILAHELAHLFGAFHPASNVESVMRSVIRSGPADRFDDQTTRILRLTRNFDFSQGVLSLTPEVRRAWSAIYAEGHERGEPNPLAAAFARAGEMLLHQAKLQEAEAALDEAIRLDANVAPPHLTLGRVYAGTGRLEDAVRELRTAKALDPGLMEARINLGFVFLQLRKDEDALSEFQDALQMDPRLERAYLGQSVALVRRGKLDEAITALTEAIKLDPSDLLALTARASALRTKGAYAEAIEDLGRVIQLRPTDAGAWNDRCYTRAVVGKLEEALADCNESLRLQPDLPNALVNRGLTYLKMDQPARALADYDAALRLVPRSALALYGRGLAKRKTGDMASGDADLAAATALSPRVSEDYAASGATP
jgi:tetratricopeptide (TPR) repeat protein